MLPDRLLIFAKLPAAGRVKTRLTPPLPPDEAASVYEACLRDVVARSARERARVELWYEDGAGAEAYFQAEFAHLPQGVQATGDLGEKLRDAFQRCFDDQGERTVIIGSDSPTLPEGVLGAAFDDLHEVDAVLGPTRDGGYYLVGVRGASWPRAERLFRGIPWSSDEVFRTTLERSAECGLELRLLPGWYDIDRLEDLQQALDDVPADSHLGRWLASPAAQLYLGR
ncbi:MAG: TIGR04282 family arsenosugar biosynthesis glycosyltransferase [Gemmatimonadetes bacterium]|nr:TIGR04282 family arsenosugar biosynthesis glycosyltransferase [Gemmatimonadota bacterium]